MALPRHNAVSHMNGHSSNGYKSHEKFDSLSISPYSSKFRPQHRTTLRRRRQTFIRIGIICLGIFVLLLLVSSNLREVILPGIGLGFLLSNHAPMDWLDYHDLSLYQGTSRGWERDEKILFCAPFRDAAVHLPMFFSHLRNLTYPHHLIDLAFLVSDSSDNTLSQLKKMLEELQADPDPNMWFGDISVLEKDFGQIIGQDFSNRHGFAAQGPRRKLMARARNWLLNATLKPYHSWVYWRDADVETAPPTILEDLMRHNKDVIVPNVWRPLPDWLGGEQPYDLNSWQESETGLELAAKLGEDDVIVEGYAEYATWRPHLAYLRDPYGDPDMEMDIDGVGGVSILAKAKVFRQGAHFPAFSFEKHAETEGFGKMAKRMKFSVIGLPHYTIWHLYEPSAEDLKHMAEMEEARLKKEKTEKEEAERKARMTEGWQDTKDTKQKWDKDQKEIINEALNDKHVYEKAIYEAEAQAQQKQQQEKGGKVVPPPPVVAPGAKPIKGPEQPVKPLVQSPGEDKAKDPGPAVLDTDPNANDLHAKSGKSGKSEVTDKKKGMDGNRIPPHKDKEYFEHQGGEAGPLAHAGESGVEQEDRNGRMIKADHH